MKKGILKKITAAALAASMVMSMGAVSSFAAGNTASSSSSPKIEEVDYEGNGRVDVDFYGKVKYKNVKVTVKDTAGKKYTAKVTAKDLSLIHIYLSGRRDRFQGKRLRIQRYSCRRSRFQYIHDGIPENTH